MAVVENHVNFHFVLKVFILRVNEFVDYVSSI